MTRRETYIEAQVCKWAKREGWRQRKVKFEGRKGAPDRWFFKAPGLIAIIEFKDPNGSLSSHQRREIRKLRAEDQNVAVIDSVEDGIEFLRKVERKCGALE